MANQCECEGFSCEENGIKGRLVRRKYEKPPRRHEGVEWQDKNAIGSCPIARARAEKTT